MTSTARTPAFLKYRSDAEAQDPVNSNEDIRGKGGIQAELAREKEDRRCAGQLRKPELFPFDNTVHFVSVRMLHSRKGES